MCVSNSGLIGRYQIYRKVTYRREILYGQGEAFPSLIYLSLGSDLSNCNERNNSLAQTAPESRGFVVCLQLSTCHRRHSAGKVLV